MKKLVLRFGLISGALLAAMTTVMMTLCMTGAVDFSNAELVGYSSMIVAFIMVFLGIRTYREQVGGGAITFGRAFKVGILITLITCAVYVVSWEIVYFGFLPDFEETYADFVIAKMRRDGKPAAEIAKTEKDMEQFKRLYKNPFFNVGMTFLEVFPVGLVMTLVSAGILRRKGGSGPVFAANSTT